LFVTVGRLELAEGQVGVVQLVPDDVEIGELRAVAGVGGEVAVAELGLENEIEIFGEGPLEREAGAAEQKAILGGEARIG